MFRRLNSADRLPRCDCDRLGWREDGGEDRALEHAHVDSQATRLRDIIRRLIAITFVPTYYLPARKEGVSLSMSISQSAGMKRYA